MLLLKLVNGEMTIMPSSSSSSRKPSSAISLDHSPPPFSFTFFCNLSFISFRFQHSNSLNQNSNQILIFSSANSLLESNQILISFIHLFVCHMSPFISSFHVFLVNSCFLSPHLSANVLKKLAHLFFISMLHLK